MTARFFTSDSHFMHRLLAIDIRGFGSIEEHDWDLIRRWNKVVREDDTVFHCGDFSLKRPEEFAWVLNELNGSIHLVTGNHDRCFPGIRNAHKVQSQYLGLFESVQPFMRVKLDIYNILISHFPYDGDGSGHGDRYAQYRLRDIDLPVIHGHTHSKDRVTRSKNNNLQVHVGMDAWDLAPVHESVVLDLIRSNSRS